MPQRLRIAVPVITLLTLAPAFSHASLEEARETLLQRSPFVKWEPPRQEFSPPPEPVVEESGVLSQQLQFNGVMQIGDETFFNVFDKIDNRSILLGINENKGRFQVVDYDNSGDRSITVQSGSGRPEKIFMATSDGVSIPTASQAPSSQTRPTANRTATSNQQRRTLPTSERRRRVIPRRINNTAGN